MGVIKLPNGKIYESALGTFDLTTEEGCKQYRAAVERRLQVEARHINSKRRL